MKIERKRRSVIKAISWRIWATMITMTIVFSVTGKLNFTLAIGGLDALFKMALYFVHERAWNRIKWGRV